MITGYERKKRLNIPYIIAMLFWFLIGCVIGRIICFNIDNSEKLIPTSNTTIISETIAPTPIPTPTPIEKPNLRYGFTDADIYLLAQLLCGDKDKSGDGEYDIDFKKDINYYEVAKVLNVVMNRVRSDKFPNTVREVVLQKGQFSVMPRNLKKKPSDTALSVVREWCNLYDMHFASVQIIPKNHLYFSGDGIKNYTR